MTGLLMAALLVAGLLGVALRREFTRLDRRRRLRQLTRPMTAQFAAAAAGIGAQMGPALISAAAAIGEITRTFRRIQVAATTYRRGGLDHPIIDRVGEMDTRR